MIEEVSPSEIRVCRNLSLPNTDGARLHAEIFGQQEEQQAAAVATTGNAMDSWME